MSAARKPATERAMEFTVSQVEFTRELAAIQAAIEKKTTVPVLTMVLIEASDGVITMTGTDLELCIRSTVPAKVTAPGAACVPANKLLGYTSLLPEGDVHLKFSENQWASVTSGRSKMRIAGMSRENFPETPEVPEAQWSIGAGLLATLITRTAFAISEEESRFTLAGSLLLLGDERATMVATDSHRLAYAVIDDETQAVSLRALLPKKAMASLAKWGASAPDQETAAISQDDNHLFVRIGQRLLITRKLTGNFPDYERVLPKDEAHTATIDKQALLDGLQRVGQFADEKSHAVRCQFASGELRVFSSTADSGESEEGIPCDYDGPDMEIGFNGKYLGEFLRVATTARVEVRVTKENAAGELRMAGDAAYRYVVMPMRI